MQSKRKLLPVALIVLVLTGLAIGYTLLNPDGDTTESRRVSVNPAGDEDPGKTERASATGQADARETHTAESAEAGKDTPRESTPAKAVLSAEVGVKVTGKALDAWDDPAPGVTLTLLAEEGEGATGPTALTDDNGAFAFTAQLVADVRYFVACLEEGKAVTATDSFTARGGEDTEGLTLRIHEEAQVYGRVLNGETDEPLPDVRVHLEGRNDARLERLARLHGRFTEARSDDAGSFRVRGIAPGKYLVHAGKDGWTANPFSPNHRAVQEVELAQWANVELMDFVLIQAGRIEGRVLARSDDSPIAGATVELGSPLGGSFDTVFTDEDGQYRFDNVPPGVGGARGPGAGLGAVSVRATAPGFAIGSRNVRVRSGQEQSGIDLRLEDGATVTGIVQDNRMQAISGARVYYNDNDFLRDGELIAGISLPERAVGTTTDDEGQFTLSGLPAGSVTITASADGFANKDHSAALTVGTPVEVQIVLEPAGGIEGHVTDADGNGVEGVPIAVYDADGPDMLGMVMRGFFGEELPDRGESSMFPASIRTDAEGYYRVEDLKASEYILIANSRDFEKYASPELDVKSGQYLVHDIRLSAGGTIFGRVYDQYTKPEAGVAVTAMLRDMSAGPQLRTAYTDSNGNYEITGLGAGTYSVTRNEGDMMEMFMPNPSNQVKVVAGRRVEFDLYTQRPGTARLYGRVTLDGEPYANQGLTLAGAGFAGFTANTTRTDERGYYEFRNVPLGTYQIARSRGPIPTLMRKRVRVNKEGNVEENIDFITVSISGRVELEGGEIPEGRVRVIASPVPADGSDATGDEGGVNDIEMMMFQEDNADQETGAFEITGLSPGFYRLSARSQDNGMVTRPYLNLRASVSGIVLTLPAEGASLNGTVVGLDDVESESAFGLIGALTIEDEQGQPVTLGGFDNGVNLGDSKEFTVENLAEGVFTVTLSLAGYAPSTHENVAFKAGEATVLTFAFETSGNARIKLTNNEIDIGAAMELEYEIVDSKGKLFKKRFTFLDFFDAEGNATQDADGNAFIIKDMPPETYTITMMLPGYRNAVETFTVVAGESTEVPVQFEPE